MNFKKKMDIRVVLAKIDFTLTILIVVTLVFSLRDKTFSPILVLLLSIIPLDLLSKQKVCLFESYLFLNYRGKEPSFTKDVAIKPQDVECYSLNNPFPAFNRCCNSGKNITLFLKNKKLVIFSAKDQELYIINWLKENFIREGDKVSRMGAVETAVCTLASLLEVLFFLNMYKGGNMPKYGIHYLIAAAAGFAYWLVYIISGIAIQKFVRVE